MVPNTEKKWLVKSGGTIMGPYGDEDVVRLLRVGDIGIFDHIQMSLGLWKYVREESAFSKVVEELRLKPSLREDTVALQENTFVTMDEDTVSGVETGSVLEGSPVISDFTSKTPKAFSKAWAAILTLLVMSAAAVLLYQNRDASLDEEASAEKGSEIIAVKDFLYLVEKDRLEEAEKITLKTNPEEMNLNDQLLFWVAQGILQYKTGRIEDARTSFKKSLELNAQYPLAQYNLAAVEVVRGANLLAFELLSHNLAQEDLLPQQRALLVQTMAKVPEDVLPSPLSLSVLGDGTQVMSQEEMFWKAYFMMRKGDSAPAESMLQVLMEQSPADLQRAEGTVDAGLTWASWVQDCEFLSHRFKSPYLVKGYCQWRAQQLTQAQVSFEEQVRLSPEESLARLYLSLIEHSKGANDKAWSWMNSLSAPLNIPLYESIHYQLCASSKQESCP